MFSCELHFPIMKQFLVLLATLVLVISVNAVPLKKRSQQTDTRTLNKFQGGTDQLVELLVRFLSGNAETTENNDNVEKAEVLRELANEEEEKMQLVEKEDGLDADLLQEAQLKKKNNEADHKDTLANRDSNRAPEDKEREVTKEKLEEELQKKEKDLLDALENEFLMKRLEVLNKKVSGGLPGK